MNTLTLATNGTSTTGEATVRIGDGPPLTLEQLRDVLVVGGVEYRRAYMTASQLLQGTTGMPIIQRTAADVFAEQEVVELREQRKLLLGLIRKGLSPLQVQALDLLIDWQTGSTLAEKLDTTPQHVANLVTTLHRMGLLARKHMPTPGPGRSPGMFRTVDAVHGPERKEAMLEVVRREARKLREAVDDGR